MLRRVCAAVCAMCAPLVLIALATGCTSGAAQTSGPRGAAALYAVAPAPLTQMTPGEKRSGIAQSFPMQIPVPKGALERAEAQGSSAWVYTIVVPGETDRVARWYLDAFMDSEWALVASSEKSLDFQKNRAQARFQFEPISSSGPPSTRVTASIGVGTEVLETH